ncbi:MAG: SDR family oxidoreductase, partial [Chloroflexota bacterium]
MNDFSRKYALVTGAGEGIGLGICRALAQRGAIVALNDVRGDVAEDAAKAINATIGVDRVFAYPGDVAKPETVFRMVDAFVETHGPPDIVIANAGITRYMEFLETTPDMFEKVVGVNLRGSYFTAQAGAKQMVAHNKRGRIILMSSVVGIQAYPNFSLYGFTKAAIQMMARTLSLELGTHGITVNAISPGATLTPRVERDDPNYTENWGTVTPTGRVGMVDDVVGAALYLAS